MLFFASARPINSASSALSSSKTMCCIQSFQSCGRSFYLKVASFHNKDFRVPHKFRLWLIGRNGLIPEVSPMHATQITRITQLCQIAGTRGMPDPKRGSTENRQIARSNECEVHF